MEVRKGWENLQIRPQKLKQVWWSYELYICLWTLPQLQYWLMIIKYVGFLFTLLWSYTFIKSQSIFKKGSGILITLFVTNISWFTFIAACFYGLKNFSFYHAFLGIALSIVLVHLAFARLTLFINNKFQDKNTLLKIKTFIEYLILITVGYFIFF